MDASKCTNQFLLLVDGELWLICCCFCCFCCFHVQANVRAPGAGVSSQIGTDSYSDMLRRELDSRFLNSTPGLGGLLPPQLGGAPSGSPNLYRPIMPTMGLPGMSPFPPHSSSYTTVSSASLPSNSSAPPSSGNMMGHLSGMSAPSASLSSLPSKSVFIR